MYKKILTGIVLIIFFCSCENNYYPRPYGYFRVDLPLQTYRDIDTLNLPYKFSLSTLAQVKERNEKGESYWIDITYPSLNASIYCSYKPVKNNLLELLEDSYKIVYKHTVRADNINDYVFEFPEKNVFGVLYDLKGNTASSTQFILTDSINHFFRGALYLNNVPNKDSIAPMAEYIQKDIIQLINSFSWKK